MNSFFRKKEEGIFQLKKIAERQEQVGIFLKGFIWNEECNELLQLA